jgi:hypothetical protein
MDQSYKLIKLDKEGDNEVIWTELKPADLT